MSSRIEDWQVMQASSNGARIASTSRVHPSWVYTEKPEWNWQDNDYRIADLTADGMRLDQLVETFPERVALLDKIYFESNYLLGTAYSGCEIKRVIDVLANYPQCISMIKIKPTRKNELRPFTYEELKQHFGRKLVSKSGETVFIIQEVNLLDDGDRCGANGRSSSQLAVSFTFEDGSPCGVLE
jgi:hypothetical protein